MKFLQGFSPTIFGGGHLRTGLFDCNPCFDHYGKRWKDIGLDYTDFGSILNITHTGSIGHETSRYKEADYLTSRCGYNWNPAATMAPEDANAERTVGAPFGPDGWLTRAKKKVEIAKYGEQFYVSQACRTMSKFARHTAGSVPELAISPHG